MRAPFWMVMCVACADGPAKRAPDVDDTAPGGGDCPGPGQVVAREMAAGEGLPGELAVGAAGDFLLQNEHAAFVITRPGANSTYYHYGGVIADAVAMDGCAPRGEDQLDEVGIVLLDIDLAGITSSNVRAFQGTAATVLSDGADGGPAVVRVTGVDATYWLVEYTLIAEAVGEGGRARSTPYGIEAQIDYILEPDSPVLRAELTLTNTGTGRVSLASAALLSFGPPMDLWGYAPQRISAAGFDLGFGMPWLVATGGGEALAYGVEAGQLAYIGISGIEVAVDVAQVLSDPMNPGPGESATRSFFLAVGGAGGSSATAPLLAANPAPIVGQTPRVVALAGAVRGPDGDPVPGARVAIEARAPGADWGVLDEATATGDGSFSASLPVFGDAWEWRVRARADGRADSAPVAVVPEGPPVEVAMGAAGALAFAFEDDSGAPSPARVVLEPLDGGARVDLWLVGAGLAPVPPGAYAWTATRGYEYAPQRGTVEVPAGGSAALDATLVRLIDTSGWVSVDTHVHTSDSADSRIPVADQLAHAAAHGLDIVVHTEHEGIFDRSAVPETAGLGAFVASIPGEEVTATIPEHLTMFPAASDGTPRGGIVEWYGRDLDELFGLMRARSGGGVNLLNHPGYLDLIGWDRLLAQPSLDDPTLLGLAPDAALWSWNFDGVEVMNGHSNIFADGNRRFDNWMSMVNAGHPVVAVGCSDDHSGWEVGFPRSYVPAGSDAPAEVAVEEVVDAFHGGEVLSSAGAFTRVALADGTGMGGLSSVTAGEVLLDLHVEALPEIDVQWVSVFVNCDEVAVVPATDAGGVVKLSEAVRIALPTEEDAHIVTAAFGAARLPLGLPQYDARRVPRALTNPIYVDTGGDGQFSAPGGRECAVRLDGVSAGPD